MKKVAILVVFLSAICFSTNVSAMGVGVTAGAYIPTESRYDVGYQLGAYFDVGVIPFLLNIRLSVNYFQADGKEDDVEYKLAGTGGRLLAILAPPFPIVNPYVGVGYGAYQNRTEATYQDHSDSSTDWGHGVVVQAGVGFKILPFIQIGLHGEYFMNRYSGIDYGGYSANVGVSLGF